MSKQKTNRKVFATTASAALVASAVVPAAVAAESVSFPDVENDPGNTWYKDAVYNLVGAGILEGDESGNFNPGDAMTRQSAAQTLKKAKGLEASESAGFNDVSDDAWYADAVNAVVEAGYMDGIPGNKFNPGGELTRQAAVKTLVETFGLEGEADLSSFSDVDDIPAWAIEDKNYFAIAVENEVLNGEEVNGETFLSPQKTISRAQFATMLDRAIKAGEAEVETPAVESVSAIDATTMQVVLDGSVSEEDLSPEDFQFDNGLEVIDIIVEEVPLQVAAFQLAETPEETKVQTIVTLITTEQEKGVSYNLVSFKGEEPEAPIEVAPAPIQVSEVTATDATTVEVSVDEDVEEADLEDKVVTLVSGETELEATYVAESLEEGVAEFELAEETELEDAAEYTVSADWAKFDEGTFQARVVDEYIAGFEKVSTELTQNNGYFEVQFVNQYGEVFETDDTSVEIDSASVNGMPLTIDTEVKYENNKVTFNTDDFTTGHEIEEADEVVVTLKNTVGEDDDVQEFTTTLEYTVIEGTEEDTLDSFSLSADTTEFAHGSETPELTINAKDEYNHDFPINRSDKIRWVVNGVVVDPSLDDGENALITNDYKFNPDDAGEYEVTAYYEEDARFSSSVTFVVGDAELSSLDFDEVTGDEKYNHEEQLLGTISPNPGAILNASDINFDIQTEDEELSADDVTVVAEENEDGDIEIKATSTEAGTYSITPYVGESVDAENTIALENEIVLETTINDEVVSMDELEFDATELKTGTTVEKELTFRNKHNEIIDATDGDINVEKFPSNVTTELVEDENGNVTSLTVNSPSAQEVNVRLTVGEERYDYVLNFADAELTTIGFGQETITGVVAGDEDEYAKYQTVNFLDQDGKEITLTEEVLNGDDYELTIEDSEGEEVSFSDLLSYQTSSGASEDEIETEADKYADVSVTNTDEIVAFKVKAAEELSKDEYTVTLTKVESEVSSSFTVEVGDARAISSLTAVAENNTVALEGSTDVLITPEDQYEAFKALEEEQSIKVSSANGNVQAGQVEEVTDDETGAIVGYKVTLTGAAKGADEVSFTFDDNDAETENSVQTTINLIVDSVGNLIDTVKINEENIASLYSTEGGLEEVKLSATAYDSSDNKVAVNTEDLDWFVDTIESSEDINEEDFDINSEGVITVPAEFSGSVTYKVQTSNIKEDTITLNFSSESPAPVTGTTAIVDADELDADEETEGLQIALDGEGNDEENGVVGLQLTATDQFGDPFVISDDEVNDAKVTTDDTAVLDVEFIEGEDTFDVTAKGVGNANVYVQYNDDILVINFDVTEEALVAKALNDLNADELASPTQQAALDALTEYSDLLGVNINDVDNDFITEYNKEGVDYSFAGPVAQDVFETRPVEEGFTSIKQVTTRISESTQMRIAFKTAVVDSKALNGDATVSDVANILENVKIVTNRQKTLNDFITINDKSLTQFVSDLDDLIAAISDDGLEQTTQNNIVDAASSYEGTNLAPLLKSISDVLSTNTSEPGTGDEAADLQ
ncbi:S-layer homology domain-containing protein [Oceanobacillus halotolerans]|uniref:S-layer homology domain-containing protein n=1 Tax=Oceanobacillus halotolerans TaxID=2663380 RepID=UPI0013DCA380|nr:S-layer homology domain-containing protein [Oceanobacillus halotolerans]